MKFDETQKFQKEDISEVGEMVIILIIVTGKIRTLR